jgi:hypothetical protein
MFGSVWLYLWLLFFLCLPLLHSRLTQPGLRGLVFKMALALVTLTVELPSTRVDTIVHHIGE